MVGAQEVVERGDEEAGRLLLGGETKELCVEEDDVILAVKVSVPLPTNIHVQECLPSGRCLLVQLISNFLALEA